ncbi:MAG: hypothetical protein AVDCRST_MAG16-2880, partial [uncultured Frankineae bacterium]
ARILPCPARQAVGRPHQLPHRRHRRRPPAGPRRPRAGDHRGRGPVRRRSRPGAGLPRHRGAQSDGDRRAARRPGPADRPRRSRRGCRRALRAGHRPGLAERRHGADRPAGLLDGRAALQRHHPPARRVTAPGREPRDARLGVSARGLPDARRRPRAAGDGGRLPRRCAARRTRPGRQALPLRLHRTVELRLLGSGQLRLPLRRPVRAAHQQPAARLDHPGQPGGGAAGRPGLQPRPRRHLRPAGCDGRLAQQRRPRVGAGHLRPQLHRGARPL